MTSILTMLRKNRFYNAAMFGLLVLVLADGTMATWWHQTGWGPFTEQMLPKMCPLALVKNKINDIMKTHSMDYQGPIPAELVDQCLQCGRELSRAANKRGAQLARSGVSLEPMSPALLHFYSGKLSPEARRAADTSHEILTATKLMQTKMCTWSNVTPNTFMTFLEQQVIRLHDRSYCSPVHLSCPHGAVYRSVDGSCNNLQYPFWGKSGSPFTRIAKPRYSDGIFSMPLTLSGRPLPNPRVLSCRLFSDRSADSRVFTLMNMQWGQFVTHDLVMRVMEVTSEGGIQCCMGEGHGILPPELENDKCIPIRVPDNDPFYAYHGVKCLNFVRSVTTPRDDCSLGHAEQMNTVTSYLDGSVMYGADSTLAFELRSKMGGKLRVEIRDGCRKGFLPEVSDKLDVCDVRNMSEPCYVAGDPRINQTPTLAMLQTLMVREHNRVSDILAKMNPFWTDEKLYQETRKIVIAEIQHITYHEWLPLNLGQNYLKYYRITPTSLFTSDYNEDVNPGIINGFGAGAFRFLHTTIPDYIQVCPAGYQGALQHRLSDHYFAPRLLEEHPDSFDCVVRGALQQQAGESDPHCSGEITNLLFKSRNQWGLDLIAMDIQRGRDHGLACYNDYRVVCGLRRATTFQDLAGEMTPDRINALQQLYECVDDVDLFVGGALETDVPGSVLGHTFQCIVAEQFYRSRVADRFFYDNVDMPHSFTLDQLRELKKCSMSRLICDNTDGVEYVQLRAFELESPYNPKCSCADYNNIPAVDFTPWKKEPFHM